MSPISCADAFVPLNCRYPVWLPTKLVFQLLSRSKMALMVVEDDQKQCTNREVGLG